MIVLGIDPGSTVTGFGCVTSHRGRWRYVGAGTVRTDSKQPMGERLRKIHDGVAAAIDRFAPDAIAIEEIFRHKSSESALRLGQARGVALLAAATRGFEAHGYNPMTVKKTIGAHGRADKDAVARMVQLLLGQELELAADATDALAIAITHGNHARIDPALAARREAAIARGAVSR
jgi:crossover junction endodeoxyribonuclease RuvC